MNCCTNPIDLGCRQSCAPITTNIANNLVEPYQLVWNFNGTYQSQIIHPVNGFVTIPGNTFNESNNVTFSIYDQNNEFIACYKASIKPGNFSDELEPPSPILLPFNTAFSIGNIQCTGDLWRANLYVQMNDIGALKNGSILDFHHEILHSGQSTPHSITCTTPGVSYIGDDLIITDITLLPLFITLLVNVTSKNCNHSFTLDAVIDHVEGLNAGYENVTNTPLNTYTWP